VGFRGRPARQQPGQQASLSWALRRHQRLQGRRLRELGQVVEAAAKRMFGEDDVHITTLISDRASGTTTNPPEKHRILAELEAIAQRSNARDILFIHLAGHGNVNAGGEFVFLTSEASSLQDGDYTGVTKVTNSEGAHRINENEAQSAGSSG